MDFQDTVIKMGLYTPPPKKRWSSYTDTLKYSRGKNHHKTPTTAKAWNDEGGKLRGCVQHL